MVHSACPLLADESFGSTNSSAQGNLTTSSGGGLGSMMGGVVGGDSGWKFFNEGSSPMEDGVTVLFNMNQHALVVQKIYLSLETLYIYMFYDLLSCELIITRIFVLIYDVPCFTY
jgi:hypothetical protein